MSVSITAPAPRPRAVDSLGRAEAAAVDVFLVGDDGYYRKGIRQLLGHHDDRLRIVGESGAAELAFARVAAAEPDVVLVDLRLRTAHAADVIRRLTTALRLLPVLVLADVEDDDELLRGIHAGACGYLLKSTPIADIAEAIRSAASGGSVLPPRMLTRVLDGLRAVNPRVGAGRDAGASLTPRELEVLRLLAAGFENGAIAAELVISTRTARNHVASILAKLGVQNRIQAAVYAVRHGLG